LVVARSPFIPGSVVRARPIAVLFLEDEHGGDEKLLTVPVDSTFPYYADVGEAEDLPDIVRQQVEHFFTHYKDLEPEKWVRVGRWGGAEEAKRVLLDAIDRAAEKAG
jgi:inorganic pyrophosphatase